MSPEELLKNMPTTALKKLAEKVIEGERLTGEEGLGILRGDHDDEATFALADFSRREKVGDTVYYAATIHINPTNLCELNCQFCSFYAKPGWDKAWFLTPEDVENRIRQHLHEGLNEIHVVGGLWRECDLDYYQDIFGRIRALNSDLHIKALTPVEYDFLAKLHGITIEEVFQKMISWGLGSLPGGGAETLVEHVRKQIAPGKISSDEFLDIHRRAHRLGLKSNMTMLFGHVEELEDLITHMEKVRTLQDETGGIQTFVPLKFNTENNALGRREKRLRPKSLRHIYATSRLMLDNIYNLKVLWNYVGVEEALAILHSGANDFSSTHFEEKVIDMAGGHSHKKWHGKPMNIETLAEILRDAGREPRLIHSGHDYVRDREILAEAS